MDRLTRKELKKDKFALEVGHTVDFLEHHRKQFIIYGSAAVALILIVSGLFYYSRRQQSARQEALRGVLTAMETPVGASPGPGAVTFSSSDEKNVAVGKALTDLSVKYSGSEEATIADYYLGTMAVNQGNLDQAVGYLEKAAKSGKKEPASLASLVLAQVYASQGKTADAEKQLRALMENPTLMVPKEEAAIALARLLAPTKPDEAHKLIDPLRTVSGPVGRTAINTYAELFLKK